MTTSNQISNPETTTKKTMLVTRCSNHSGLDHTLEIEITPAQLAEVNERNAYHYEIKDVVPHLTPNERLFLMDGITPEEWEIVFSDVELDA